MRTDVQFGSNPLHITFMAVSNFYERYNDKLRDLNVRLEINEINQDEYDSQLEKLEFEKLLVDAEINIQAKQKLRFLKNQLSREIS